MAFPNQWPAVLIGWGIVLTGILSAATIATGFVAYASLFTDWSKYWILPVLVGIPTLVAVSGIKQSAWFMAAITAAGLFGLVIVLWNAGPNIPQWPDQIADAGPILTPVIAGSVLVGAFLAFYAFIGFEDLAHLGEEVKAARRSIPAAIFFTLLISLLLYVAVAAAAVTTLPVDRIAASSAPLIDVVEQTGGGGSVVAVLSLLTIADGLLAQIVMVSRTVYDLGERRKAAPRWLASLSTKTHTPAVATALIGTAILALALMFETRALASGTSSVILLIFATANLALIVLKRRAPRPEAGFRAWSWIPYAGATSCLLLLGAQFLISNTA